MLVAVLLFTSTVFAGENLFFEVGKTYLFIPRIGVVERGIVIKVTDQEVVFNDRSLLITSNLKKVVQSKASH